MIFKGDRNIFAVFAFVAVLIFCAPSSSWAQRRCCEGDTWMKWTEDHRDDYLRGYILGYAEGYTGACYKMTKYLHPPISLGEKNNPLSSCLAEMPDFSRGPEYFAKQITELYTTYPQDRILLVTEILVDLVSGKSIQEIHENPPFPTNGSSPSSSSPH
jgi:hypothetical protein